MWNCYNEKTHTCDGSCQGCTDCPMAHNVQVSKRVMKLYIKKSIERKKEWDEIMEELKNDKKFMSEIQKMCRRIIR